MRWLQNKQSIDVVNVFCIMDIDEIPFNINIYLASGTLNDKLNYRELKHIDVRPPAVAFFVNCSPDGAPSGAN